MQIKLVVVEFILLYITDLRRNSGSCEYVLANNHINHKVFAICYVFSFQFFLLHIISVTDFPLFCSHSARKCLILPAECSPQKSLILLEILPAEFIHA